VAVAGSPTVRRRRLGAELRAIREARQERGEDVARELGWSPAKVSRYELARTMLQETDVGRLLDYYEITGDQRAQLLALAKDAAEKGWWEEDSDAITSGLEQLIGLEAEARSIAIWRMAQVPGLLQTEAYARSIIAGFDRVERTSPGLVERRVQVRMRRQQVLSRDPPLELSVVLDESVLHRKIGSQNVMYEQLQRLAREAERPNVSLQVFPLRADHPVIAESFLIFSFGRLNSEDPTAGILLHDVVSTETLKRDFYVEGESETYLHRLAFDILRSESLDPTASRALVLETAASLWRDN
jgi:transcriptional regulator with XRE-family HTH domain